MKILAVCPKCKQKTYVNWIGELCEECKGSKGREMFSKIFNIFEKKR